MRYSEHYHLRLPQRLDGENDAADIEDLNYNTNIIDRMLDEVEQELEELDASKASVAQLNAHASAEVLAHPDGSVTDEKIGLREIGGVRNKLQALLALLGEQVKGVKGTDSWNDAPAITLAKTAETLNNHAEVARVLRSDLDAHKSDKVNPHAVTAHQAGAYTKQETDNKDATVKTALENALNTHKGDKVNPHGVTKAQVGLGNVPNVATNNQTPTYTVGESLTGLTSGETLTVAMGKLAKAVQGLQEHLANRSNPHSVTKSQVGLGNVTNDAQVKRSEMGKAGGVATLDTRGRIPAEQLPETLSGKQAGVFVLHGTVKPDETGSIDPSKPMLASGEYDMVVHAQADISRLQSITVHGYTDMIGSGTPSPTNRVPFVTAGNQANLLDYRLLYNRETAFDAESGSYTRPLRGWWYDIFTNTDGLGKVVSDTSRVLHLEPNTQYYFAADSVVSTTYGVSVFTVALDGTPTQAVKISATGGSKAFCTTSTGLVTVRIEGNHVCTAKGLRITKAPAPYTPFNPDAPFATVIKVVDEPYHNLLDYRLLMNYQTAFNVEDGAYTISEVCTEYDIFTGTTTYNAPVADTSRVLHLEPNAQYFCAVEGGAAIYAVSKSGQVTSICRTGTEGLYLATTDTGLITIRTSGNKTIKGLRITKAEAPYTPFDPEAESFPAGKAYAVPLTEPLCHDDKVELVHKSGCDKCVRFDGSENWGIVKGTTFTITGVKIDAELPVDNGQSVVGYTNAYPVFDAQYLYGTRMIGFGVTKAGDVRLNPGNRIKTVEGLKQYLQKRPLTVWYKSANYTPERDIPLCLETHKNRLLKIDGSGSTWKSDYRPEYGLWRIISDSPLPDFAYPNQYPICDAARGAWTAANNTVQISSNLVFINLEGYNESEDATKKLPAYLNENPITIVASLASPVVYAHPVMEWEENPELANWAVESTEEALLDLYLKPLQDGGNARTALVARNAENANQLQGHSWEEVAGQAPVQTVNGKKGAVQLTAADVGAAVPCPAASAVPDASSTIATTATKQAVPLKVYTQSSGGGFTAASGGIVMPKAGTVAVSMQLMVAASKPGAYLGLRLKCNDTYKSNFYAEMGDRGYGCLSSMPLIFSVAKGDVLTFEVTKESDGKSLSIAVDARTGVFIQYV